MSGGDPVAVAQPRQPGPPPAAPRSRMKRRVIVLMILVAIVAVGWSAFWWQASRTLDSLAQDFLENSARNGVTVRCERARSAAIRSCSTSAAARSPSSRTTRRRSRPGG